MAFTVFIDGAAGTTGLEIADRLWGRSEFTLITLGEERRKDAAARYEALNAADFVILCLPDDAAIQAVGMIDNDRTRVIDASTAFRIDPEWAYGFAEYREDQRAKIATAQRVSNPGCYPTGFLALIAPLIAAKLLPANWPYTVNALSGYSGGGKSMIERFEAEGNIGARGYGFDLAHKHLPEMQVHAGLSSTPIFAPTVVNAYRGMIVEVPLPLSEMPGAARADTLGDALAKQYATSPIVHVHTGNPPSELLIQDGQEPTDRLDLYVASNADGSRARLVAMLDNLGKGASGAAVQNLNIMAGLDETSGLRL